MTPERPRDAFDPAELRRRAEAVTGAQADVPSETLASDEVRRSLYELRVHQFELEMQNDELRRVQAELETSQSRYFDLFDMAPVGYVMLEEQGVTLEANLSIATLLGVPRGQLIGQPLDRFIVPEDQDLSYRRRKQLFRDGVAQAYELRLRGTGADPLWVRIDATAAVDAGGTPICRAALTDITARKEAEAEILRLNGDLEERVLERTAELRSANEELQAFSYSVSHDLRAPLRAISGFASILGRRYRDGLDEQGRHYVDTIAASGEHLGVLIEELLDYARMGRGAAHAEPVPLGPIIERLRVIAGEQIAAAGGTLEVIEPLAVPDGDPVLLERILANLVENAVTYCRPTVAPVVTISAVRHGDAVVLAVADNGIGIPTEYLEKIFEVFTHLHAAEAYPGTGIGLAIVRKAARRMGSDVTVTSEVGVGSTFTIELPAADEEGVDP